MSTFWVVVALGWLPVIPAALAYLLVGGRIWPVAVGLAVLGAVGWGLTLIGAQTFGLGLMGLAALALPGVLAAALAPEVAEEETVAGFVYLAVSALLVFGYFAVRDGGTI